MRRFHAVLIALVLGGLFASAAEIGERVAIKTAEGWKMFVPTGEEYAEIFLKGSQVDVSDPDNILLTRDTRLSVTFADKKQFTSKDPLLVSHAKWEIAYQKTIVRKVESTDRSDLAQGRRDLKVTQITVQSKEGIRGCSYLIGLASKDGVVVFSVSPAGPKIDGLTKEIVSSIRLVKQPFDVDVITRESDRARQPNSSSAQEKIATQFSPSDTSSPPGPLHNPPPNYPLESKRANEEGSVLLSVRVDAAGRADTVTVSKSSGFPRLDRAALEAVRSWKFTPSIQNGTPVASTLDVPIVFRLGDSPKAAAQQQTVPAAPLSKSKSTKTAPPPSSRSSSPIASSRQAPSANAAPSQYATKVPGKSGWIRSPYNGRVLDATGIIPGTFVKDPETGQVMIVP